MKRIGFLATVALAFIAGFSSIPAQAQNPRSFVSPTGSDSNPCTLTAPCRNLQAALAVTNSGGEIVALGTAGYSGGATVTITQPVSIVSPAGIEAGIIGPSGGPAILVFMAGVVSLRGLTIEGEGAATDGVQWQGGNGSADRLEIVDCSIRNFTHDGINIDVFDGLTVQKTILISNTIASDNGSSGIEIAPGMFFPVRGAIDNATVANNGQNGILINATGATGGGFVDVAISNSLAESNGNAGIVVEATGNAKAEIKNSTMSNNFNTGLVVSSAIVGISGNSIVLNGAGFSNSGTLNSFVNNAIENNRGSNTGATNPVSPQ
jgi:hypothetical protein